jgi:uncharacterized membrane protein YtjA (UPF0391 family)
VVTAVAGRMMFTVTAVMVSSAAATANTGQRFRFFWYRRPFGPTYDAIVLSFDVRQWRRQRFVPAGTFKVSPGLQDRKEHTMSLLKWALIMLVVSLVAALFGFTGLSVASAEVARILFFIFVVIFLVLLVAGLMGARAARGP